MIFSTSRYDHITPFLRQLHWLKAEERIDYKLAVLVHKCLHGTDPAYLADELSHSSDFANHRKLRSASSLNLIVHRTRLSTYDDRAFPATGPVSGTVFHLTSLLRRQSTFLNPALRLFSSLAPIRNLIVSPCVKCLCSACGISDTIIVRSII